MKQILQNKIIEKLNSTIQYNTQLTDSQKYNLLYFQQCLQPDQEKLNQLVILYKGNNSNIIKQLQHSAPKQSAKTKSQDKQTQTNNPPPKQPKFVTSQSLSDDTAKTNAVDAKSFDSDNMFKKSKKKEMSFSTALNDLQKNNAEIHEPSTNSTKQQIKNQLNQLNEVFQQQNKPVEKPDSENKYINILLSSNVLITSLSENFQLKSICGMDLLKKSLEENILLPLLHPALFKQNNVQIYNKFLLHSLPGCGKSFFVKCIAGQVQYNLIQISPAQIFSKYQGQSEKLIKAVFELSLKQKPCILFLDEIDALCSQRREDESESSRRVKNEILAQIDQLDQEIILIGATNLPFEIDSAVRRRFEKRILVELPDEEARKEMIEKWLIFQKDREISIKEILQGTEGYSGADVGNVIKSINHLPIQVLQSARYFRFNEVTLKYEVCGQDDANAQQKTLKDLANQAIQSPEIGVEEIKSVLKKIKSSVSKKDMDMHIKFQNEYGSE